eukprot:4850302-Amphidinium_carterae.2
MEILAKVVVCLTISIRCAVVFKQSRSLAHILQLFCRYTAMAVKMELSEGNKRCAADGCDPMTMAKNDFIGALLKEHRRDTLDISQLSLFLSLARSRRCHLAAEDRRAFTLIGLFSFRVFVSLMPYRPNDLSLHLGEGGRGV